MLTSGDLGFMRDSIEELFPDTCDILSRTTTVNSAGGFTEAWGTAHASVACRGDWLTGLKQYAGGAIQPFRQLQFSVPYDTDVTTENRIKWSGGEYAIEKVNENSWIACKFLEVNAIN